MHTLEYAYVHTIYYSLLSSISMRTHNSYAYYGYERISNNCWSITVAKQSRAISR